MRFLDFWTCKWGIQRRAKDIKGKIGFYISEWYSSLWRNLRIVSMFRHYFKAVRAWKGNLKDTAVEIPSVKNCISVFAPISHSPGPPQCFRMCPGRWVLGGRDYWKIVASWRLSHLLIMEGLIELGRERLKYKHFKGVQGPVRAELQSMQGWSMSVLELCFSGLRPWLSIN